MKAWELAQHREPQSHLRCMPFMRFSIVVMSAHSDAAKPLPFTTRQTAGQPHRESGLLVMSSEYASPARTATSLDIAASSLGFESGPNPARVVVSGLVISTVRTQL